ncbi:hypothetical protein [uncultured Enterobacter sp.]|uniref:hypothetical protein n=1 Tax=uncultured Enterobacter sp. TaxID=238202 RepID=UPI0025DF0155|nr:hypothetical protein [uncultured Enterobacter sp.]
MSDEITEYTYYEKYIMGKVNVFELFMWFLISFIIFRYTSLVDIFTSKSKYGTMDISYLSILFSSVAVMLVPLAYTIISKTSPFQDAFLTIFRFKPIDISKFLPPKGVKDSPIAYMAHLCKSSEDLSKSIFNRGVVYLMMGVTFAVAGLLFFYAQVTIDNIQSDFKSELLHYAPKFGILFFIEFISFYFLKQYRSTMDEFRYYESLKRSREENLLILKLIIEKAKPEEVLGFVEKFALKSNAEKLIDGQTLDILESKKLEKGELEVLVKAIEALRPKT